MRFKATVPIMPYKDILDPKGEVMHGLKNLGFDHSTGVRKDKRMKLEIEAESKGVLNIALMSIGLEQSEIVRNPY